jgi:hypothetical protein
VLRAESEIDCAKCRRAIPADSRFCSFCGAETTYAPAEDRVAADHEAETVLLSVPPSADERARTPSRNARLYYRTRHARRPILMLVLIFVGGFAIVRAVSYLLTSDTSRYNPPDATRADAPIPGAPAPAAPAPDAEPGAPPPDTAPSTPEFLTARLEAFRAALDAGGLTGVHFRMVGGTMELWGTVPDATDRAMVQMLALNVAGVASLRDHIQVRGGSVP